MNRKEQKTVKKNRKNAIPLNKGCGVVNRIQIINTIGKGKCPSPRRHKKKKHCPRPPQPKSQVRFTELKYLDVAVDEQAKTLPSQDTSLQTTYSYAVINHGKAPVYAYMEISPDNIHFAIDGGRPTKVAAGKTAILVPKKYLHFTRVVVETEESGQSSVIDMYYQAQSA